MTQQDELLLRFEERIKITDEALRQHYRKTMECKRVSSDYILMMTEGGDSDAVAYANAKAQLAKVGEWLTERVQCSHLCYWHRRFTCEACMEALKKGEMPK